MCFFLSPSYNCFFSPSHELPLPSLSSRLLPLLQSSLRRRSHRICSLWRFFHLISTRSLSSSRNHLEFQVYIS
ncbi:hypothetical protein AHAS_Ahas16G0189300 [Arachis hypogaea]